MYDVNLLPWRETAMHAKRKACLILALFAVSIPITISVLDWHLSARLNKLTNENERLAKSINSHSIGNITNTQNLLDGLVRYRKKMLAILSSIPVNQVKNVCLEAINSKSGKYEFNGRAASVLSLLTFLQKWPANEYFAAINVKTLNKNPSGSVSFSLLAPELDQVNLLPESSDG